MQLSILLTLGLPFFATVANAANCTPFGREPWSQVAVNMMWDLRHRWCAGSWWADVKMVVNNDWCDNDFCYRGWWYGHSHPSQQACWDVTEQIIRQCMPRYGNGGWWSWGSEYTEGWFYHTSGPYKREVGSPAAAAGHIARSAKNNDPMQPDDDPHVVHLLNGTVVKADKVLYVTTTFGKDGKNETKISEDPNA